MRPHFKLSPGDKVQVVSLRAGGMTWTDIGRLLDIDRRTASCCYDAVMERNSYERKRGTGKMRKTSRREDQHLLWYIRNHRFSTSRDAKAHCRLPQLSERSIGEMSEFSSYWCSRKPYINENNRARRVAWAREQWHKVLWTDESPYVLRFNQRQRVWRVRGEANNPRCTRATVKHDEKVMVWGCFAAHGVGHLHRIETKNVYVGILEDHMYPSTIDMFDEEVWIG